MTITVAASNDAPVAVNDSASTAQGTAVSGTVLGNDTDVDAGTVLTASLAASPANGTVTLAANGSFTYTPAANFSGTDSFTYRSRDASLISNAATVTITVTAVSDPVVFSDDFERTGRVDDQSQWDGHRHDWTVAAWQSAVDHVAARNCRERCQRSRDGSAGEASVGLSTSTRGLRESSPRPSSPRRAPT